MSEENNPFQELSQIFVDSQRLFNVKCEELKKRSKSFSDKLVSIQRQIEQDPFGTNLNVLLGIEEEAKLTLSVARELEHHRDKILKSIEVLKESNKTKLNK